MSEMYIRDSIDFELPNSLTVKDETNKHQVEIKDAISTDTFLGRALEITVDATHCGYFNRNGYFYVKKGMADSASSFLEPYGKPILKEHDGSGKPLGRAVAAAFLPIKKNTFDMNTKEAKIKGRPTGKIRVKALITDEQAIKDILESRYMTVSIGGRPTSPPKCSICGEHAVMGFFGPQLSCDHELGDVDEKKGYIGIVVDGMDYSEFSFVNHPSDYSSDHVAKVVSMSLITQDLAKNEDSFNIEFGDEYLYDGLKTKKEDNNMAVKDELLQKAKELGIEVTDDMTDEKVQELIAAKEKEAQDKKDATDNNTPPEKTFEELVKEFEDALEKCEECDEDISKFWEDESEEEIEALQDLIDEYDAYIDEDPDGLIPQDAKLSAEKRKKLGAKTFCGPNRSFPVPDCAHVTAARRLIGRYKGEGNKSKILACVNRKAKNLGCDSSSKDSAEDKVLQELQKKHDELVKANKETEDKLVQITKDLEDKTNTLQASDAKIIELTTALKDALAEKLVDLSLMAEDESVKELMQTADGDEFTAKYAEVKDKVLEKEMDEIKETIMDLRKKSPYSGISQKIDNPTLDSPVNDSDIKDPFMAILDNRKKEHKEKTDVMSRLLNKGYSVKEEK